MTSDVVPDLMAAVHAAPNQIGGGRYLGVLKSLNERPRVGCLNLTPGTIPAGCGPHTPRLFKSPYAAAIAADPEFDRKSLLLAESVARSHSHDPSTQCGCVVVTTDHRVTASWNRFADGIENDPEKHPERYLDRETKMGLTLHGEMTAVLSVGPERMKGATVYTWPFAPCANCAAVLCEVGVARVVAPPTPGHLQGRWGKSLDLAATQFKEKGIRLDIIDLAGEV